MKATQSCLTLLRPMDHTVHGILQARILEWVAYPFSSRTPIPGIKLGSPTLQADSLPAELPGKPMFFSSLYRLSTIPVKYLYLFFFHLFLLVEANYFTNTCIFGRGELNLPFLRLSRGLFIRSPHPADSPAKLSRSESTLWVR